MRKLKLVGMLLLVLVDAGTGSVTLAATTASGAATAAGNIAVAWKHHVVQFSYFGQTTLYSCPGLEDKVRKIFLFLGARNDLRVRADGCPGIDAPAHTAFVRVEFDSLAPLDSPTDGAEVAVWTPFSLSARQPRFMGEGDCELVQDMKDVIAKNFDLRHLAYETSCFPHELSSEDFSVSGEALRMPAGRMLPARLKVSSQ